MMQYTFFYILWIDCNKLNKTPLILKDNLEDLEYPIKTIFHLLLTNWSAFVVTFPKWRHSLSAACLNLNDETGEHASVPPPSILSSGPSRADQQ